MPITKKYSLSAVEIADTEPILLSGITSQGLGTNSEVDVEATSAEPYPRWYALTGQNPGGRFATYHLATALAAIGLTGLDISAQANGLNLWLQKHAAGGTRAGAASHNKYNFTEGMLVLGNLSCAFGGNAVLTCRILSNYDGLNAPFTVTASQSLPTAEEDDERFTLGPVTIETEVLTQIRQFDIEFGLKIEQEAGDSDLFPTFISIETITPTLTLRGIDPDWLGAEVIPLLGKDTTHANTAIYLRKRSATGFVIDETAEHIKLTAAGLAYIDTVFDAQGQGAAESSLVLPMRWDGTNLPLAINTASAIT